MVVRFAALVVSFLGFQLDLEIPACETKTAVSDRVADNKKALTALTHLDSECFCILWRLKPHHKVAHGVTSTSPTHQRVHPTFWRQSDEAKIQE